MELDDQDWRDYVDWDVVDAYEQELRDAEERCSELVELIDNTAARLNRAVARESERRQHRANPRGVTFDLRALLAQKRIVVTRVWWQDDGPLGDRSFFSRADAVEDDLVRLNAAIGQLLHEISIVVAHLDEVPVSLAAPVAAPRGADRPAIPQPRVVALPHLSHAPTSLTPAPLEWARVGRLAA